MWPSSYLCPSPTRSSSIVQYRRCIATAHKSLLFISSMMVGCVTLTLYLYDFSHLYFVFFPRSTHCVVFVAIPSNGSSYCFCVGTIGIHQRSHTHTRTHIDKEPSCLAHKPMWTSSAKENEPMTTQRQQYNKSKSTHTVAYFIFNAQIMVR